MKITEQIESRLMLLLENGLEHYFRMTRDTTGKESFDFDYIDVYNTRRIVRLIIEMLPDDYRPDPIYPIASQEEWPNMDYELLVDGECFFGSHCMMFKMDTGRAGVCPVSMGLRPAEKTALLVKAARELVDSPFTLGMLQQGGYIPAPPAKDNNTNTEVK